jgi:hypothetical protein
MRGGIAYLAVSFRGARHVVLLLDDHPVPGQISQALNLGAFKCGNRLVN